MLEIYSPAVLPFTIHKNGIEIDGEATFEEWLACGDIIKSIDSSIHWLIGDWLNYGEKKYGEKYEDAIKQSGFEYGTIAQDKWVAGSVEFCTRVQNLSFSHHRVVAPYTPEEQKILLRKAEEMKLSAKELQIKKDSLLPKGVQPGQWWKLGQHLLYCGDSTSQDYIDRCRQAEAHFVFADPPYNAGVAEWDSGFEWNHDYLEGIAPIVAVTPGISSIRDFMRVTNMPYRWSMSYWINNGQARGALGFGNWIYVSLFTEGSLYRNEQDLERIDLDERWDCETVSVVGGDHDPLKHKGRKPIRMMSHIVTMFTQEGETIVDPFLGTGTTLIACEQLGRVCIGAELSVEYCESIIKRWEKLTECEAEVIE